VALELKVTPVKPARAGDPVVTVSGVTSVARTTFAFRQVMFNALNGEALAVAEKTAALLDHATRKAVRLSEDLRAAISAHLVPG
jgi:acyl-CoA thioester hydrolase